MGLLKILMQRATLKALSNMSETKNYLFIQDHSLFKDLSSAAQLFLIKRLMDRRYSKEEIIFKQENPGICLFFVQQGSVEVYLEEKGKEPISYGILKKGTLFGEMSIVSENYRTASAKSMENDTVLLALSKFDIDDLNLHYPYDGLIVLKGLTDTVIRSLMHTTKKLREINNINSDLQGKLDKYETK